MELKDKGLIKKHCSLFTRLVYLSGWTGKCQLYNGGNQENLHFLKNNEYSQDPIARHLSTGNVIIGLYFVKVTNGQTIQWRTGSVDQVQRTNK